MTLTKDGKNSGQTGHHKVVKRPKRRKESPAVTVARITQIGAIVVGIITVIGVIIGAVLNFPPVIQYFNSTPIPVFLPSPTITNTPVPSPSATSDVTMTPSPVPATETPLPVSPSPEPARQKMIVVVEANMTNGKAPLLVSFNAENSYVQSEDENDLTCSQNRLCTYSWAVYRGNKQLGKSVTGSCKFSHTFTEKGTYFVTVSVCRGSTCETGATTIEVR